MRGELLGTKHYIIPKIKNDSAKVSKASCITVKLTDSRTLKQQARYYLVRNPFHFVKIYRQMSLDIPLKLLIILAFHTTATVLEMCPRFSRFGVV